MNAADRLPPPACLVRLRAFCARSRPQSMLLVSPYGADRFGLTEAEVGCAVQARLPATLARETRRFDLALVIGAVEMLDREEALGLVSRLRDLNSRRLLLLLDTDAAGPGPAAWREQDWLAMGMRRLDPINECKERFLLYAFSIADYKLTPEWLNSRFWAHPERFGKYRW
jgi:Family of unknown function (DUF6231)